MSEIEITQRYDVIYCDVPWFYNSRKAGNERNYLPTRFGGGAEKHYPLMKDAEILAMRTTLDNWAAKNCALFMWATCPRLDSAIDVIKGWGFRYCTVAFVWEKITKPSGRRGLVIPPATPIYGPGYYTGEQRRTRVTRLSRFDATATPDDSTDRARTSARTLAKAERSAPSNRTDVP